MKICDCDLHDTAVCEKGDSVLKAAVALKDKRRRHVVVLDEGKPLGIISTTDINNRLVAEGKNAEETKAFEIMTEEIIIKDIIDDVSSAYADMLKKNVFFCLIVDEGKFVGTLGLRDTMCHLSKMEIKEDGKKQ